MEDLKIMESVIRTKNCNDGLCPPDYYGKCPFEKYIDNNYVTKDNLCEWIGISDWELELENRDEGSRDSPQGED